MSTDLPVRFCPLCKIADTAPRHTIYGEDPNVARHFDCCRTAGCPDGSCDVLTAGAEDLRGDDLRAHLTDPAKQEAFQAALDARDETTRTFTTDTPPIILERFDQ